MSDLRQQLENRQPVSIGSVTVERPVQFDMSPAGGLIVMDEGKMQEVRSTVFVFDGERKQLFQKTVPSAGAACVLDDEERFACFATVQPDDQIYYVDLGEGEVAWTRENHQGRSYRSKRAPITNLEVDGDCISVYTGEILEYELNREGKLLEQYQQEQRRFHRLDEEPAEEVSFLNEYLSSGDRTKIVKAMVEIELRLEQDEMRNQLGELVSAVAGAIEEENVHQVDLTETGTSSAVQKIMSSGKRILYEAGRENSEWIRPHLDLIKTHLDAQPETVIQSDLEQLEQVVPDGMEMIQSNTEEESPLPNESLIQHLKERDDLDEEAKQEAIRKLREQDQTSYAGCARCLTYIVVFIIIAMILICLFIWYL